jgi:hypothetical protein
MGPMTPPTDQPADDGAHDVLAAEEFGVPAPDPVLHETSQPAHDVLAAEEFEVGSGDPALHHGPLRLPDDPSGIAEPHDVLAAEEFAVPAGPAAGSASGTSKVGLISRVGGALGLGALVTMLVRRRRR